MRCRTLACYLIERGYDIQFVCGGIRNPATESLVTSVGARCVFSGEELDEFRDAASTISFLGGEQPALVVVDNYSLGESWHKTIRKSWEHAKLLVIDDLANRALDCDFLLDQNLFADPEARYRSFVSASTVTLLGPRYALLRPEFYAKAIEKRSRSERPRKVLLSFGGSDPTNETEKCLRALSTLPSFDRVDIVLGGLNPNADLIRNRFSHVSEFVFHQNVGDMASLMSQVDICIGAGGSTSWERCLLGLPSAVVTVADNQLPISQELELQKCIFHLGQSHRLQSSDYAAAIERLCSDGELRFTLASNSLRIMLGNELPHPVIKVIDV